MPEIRELTLLIKKLEDQLDTCTRCGVCQAVCPVFAETGREADVARGKLALLDGLKQEIFKKPKQVSERLNRCLLCGSCVSNCPAGVSVLEIFINARAILSGFMGLSRTQKMILRGVLAYPETFDRIMEWLRGLQWLFTKPADDFLGTSCARFASPFLRDRHFISLAPVPFHRMPIPQEEIPGGSGIKVAFFTGCLIDKVFPRIARDTIDVLNLHKIEVFLPQGQGCCGIPAISSGDAFTFKRLVHHHLKLLEAEEFDFLVTSCATCTYTIKKIWPMMLQDDAVDFKAGVARLAEKTMDINQFLVLKTGLKKKVAPGNDSRVIVSYHDPCHLKKSLGVSDEPRDLIRANPRYRLKEMEEPDRCCGLGGSFSLEHYDISTRIGKRKLDHIQTSGCAVVATGCPACMIQLADMLSKSGIRIGVKHPVELYAESLKDLKL